MDAPVVTLRYTWKTSTTPTTSFTIVGFKVVLHLMLKIKKKMIYEIYVPYLSN